MLFRAAILTSLLASIALAIAAPSLAAEAPALKCSTALSPEHAAVKSLMEKESGATIDDKWLEIAPIDLDRDGTPELFVMAINTDYFCGDAGCRPTIYAKDGDGWRKLDLGLNDFTNSAPDMWSVEKKPQNGHLVLVLKESQFTARYVWDGAAYSEAQ
jgi:hypothetical protein